MRIWDTVLYDFVVAHNLIYIVLAIRNWEWEGEFFCVVLLKSVVKSIDHAMLVTRGLCVANAMN